MPSRSALYYETAAAPNASCAVPEAQGARPACPLPPPKNPLNADSGFGNGACCAGASATADEAGGVSATRIRSRFTRLGLCLRSERLAMLLQPSDREAWSGGGLLISLLRDTVAGVVVDRIKFHSILDDLHPWLVGILNDFFRITGLEPEL